MVADRDVADGSALLDSAVRARDGGPPAVLCPATGDTTWLDDLDDVVANGRLVIPRTVLPSTTPADLVSWVRSACAALPPRLLAPLVADLDQLSRALCAAGGVTHLMARLFTEAPSARCGFHVDTVTPQAPPVGALRVYNGPTTQYVEAADVVDTGAFYRYLSRRERLSRQPGTDPAELSMMDEQPGFLRPGAAVRTVPEHTTVFFRHLAVNRHWSAHPADAAWIHRSPTVGTPRLVVNLSPVDRIRPGRGRGSGTHG